jgi:hypothetical protein
MELSRSEIISILALLVSALSLGVAFLSYWRSYLAQQPIAWLEVQPTLIPNEWLGKIHILNRSTFGWRVVQADVPLTKFPVTDKQDFLIRAAIESENENTSPAAPPATVGDAVRRAYDLHREQAGFNLQATFSGGILPGESGTCSIILRRGPLSDASAVTIKFTIQSMVAKPRNKTLTIKATLPRPSLTMVLD